MGLWESNQWHQWHQPDRLPELLVPLQFLPPASTPGLHPAQSDRMWCCPLDQRARALALLPCRLTATFMAWIHQKKTISKNLRGNNHQVILIISVWWWRPALVLLKSLIAVWCTVRGGKDDYGASCTLLIIHHIEFIFKGFLILKHIFAAML